MGFKTRKLTKFRSVWELCRKKNQKPTQIWCQWEAHIFLLTTVLSLTSKTLNWGQWRFFVAVCLQLIRKMYKCAFTDNLFVKSCPSHGVCGYSEDFGPWVSATAFRKIFTKFSLRIVLPCFQFFMLLPKEVTNCIRQPSRRLQSFERV